MPAKALPMAPSFTFNNWCFALSLLLLCPHCCQAQKAISITARAMLCFNNMTIYKNCQSQYRLTANGTLNVPSNATNFFCNGQCLEETQLVLGCVGGILSNFKFYNGATVQAVNSTVVAACGNTSKRGNFNVSQNIVGIVAAGGNRGNNSLGNGLPSSQGLPSSHVHVPDAGNLCVWLTGLLMLMIIV